jgi:hypothetical protein
MSFLSEYREYVSGTEAHPTYHIFSSLFALSSIVSRRVWVDMGYFNVFPNIYVILVGPAGNRKTSAMTPAKNILRELKLPFSAECVTKEKLVLDIKQSETICAALSTDPAYQRMSTYAPMAIAVTELSEFLGAGGLGMVNFLTTIYDQDFYDIRTKNKGSELITGPYLTLLACTTPDWITSYLRQDVISGGFSRRAIFAFETEDAGRVAFPVITPRAQEAWQKVLAYGQQLTKVSGPMVWAPGSKEWFENWYINLKMPADPTTTGYYRSKHIQLLKVATLLSLSEDTSRNLTVNNLKAALDILSMIETNLGRVFMGIGRNELNGIAVKMINCLEQLPPQKFNLGGSEPLLRRGCPEKRLMSMFFSDGNQQELVQVIAHLVSSGKAERVIVMHNNDAIPYITLR